AGRTSAQGTSQRRSSSARTAPTSSAKTDVRRTGSAPKSPSPQKKIHKGLTVSGAVIIAVVAVIVICVPLILLTTSSAKAAKELPQEQETILIAPATAVPGETTTVAEEETTSDPGSTETDAPEAKSFQRDDEDPEISRIQQRLMELGFMRKSEPTQLFGPATEESVKLFQTMNDLTSNGVADAETQEALFSEQANSFILEEGMENIAVSQLQSKLRSLGYLNANATGYYGTSTASAVKNFQKQHDLDADGKVGISTWDKVFSSSAKKAPEPSKAPEETKAPETEA
ncbi:MAG: peptidoglycan-binding protein, partial [Christensenellaceae bacterium]|nr:peptidoglycan-binding protein [Christensenellaceae bacterium]